MASSIEAEDIFEASSKSLRQLLSENGLGFYIPPYQRPYSWSSDNVDKLLNDTIAGLGSLVTNPESFTFLGTIIVVHDTQYVTVNPIVKAEVPSKVLIVIDGQQRLSTLMLLTIALHNHLRLSLLRLLNDKEIGGETDVTWFHNEAKKAISQLANMVFENQNYGESPVYPRMIRAYSDQWSTNPSTAKYESPISNITRAYVDTIQDLQNPTAGPIEDFKPKPRAGVLEGEAAVTDRYAALRRSIIALSKGSDDERFDSFPSIEELTKNNTLQESLFSHQIPGGAKVLLDKQNAALESLTRILMLTSYFKDRVAVTRVKGKDENYAFAIFESLNTTGEPLTAFETFKPRAVLSEGLNEYGDSITRTYIDQISEYLDTFKLGNPVQEATKDLIVSFASAETGSKLSKRLPEQRAFLRDEFDRHSANPSARIDFVRHFSESANLMRGAWSAKDISPQLIGFDPDETTDSIKLCFDFLRQLKHSVTLAPLTRFYADALRRRDEGEPNPTVNFGRAIRAVTGFSVIWRAASRGTANIDRQYRELMSGSTTTPQFARTVRRGAGAVPSPIVDIDVFTAELAKRLADRGIGDEKSFVDAASKLPLYKYPAIARFLLMSAHDDAVTDGTTGLVQRGKAKVSPALTFLKWRDEDFLSLEHVAPQGGGQNWPLPLYEDSETVDRLGNLVLVPAKANSSLSNREWAHKRILYRALGASTTDAARQELETAEEGGITFADSTSDLVSWSTHTPQLATLGQRDGDWDSDFIDLRGERLLRLAWGRISPWVGLAGAGELSSADK